MAEIPFSIKVNVTDVIGVADDVANASMSLAEKRLRKAMFFFEKKVKEKLSQRGSGRIYPSRKGKGQHQASAPGEPPAPDIGELRASWSSVVRKIRGNQLVGSLLSDKWLKGGRRLELGGSGGGAYIAPRPYLRPTYDEIESQLQRIINGEDE